MQVVAKVKEKKQAAEDRDKFNIMTAANMGRRSTTTERALTPAQLATLSNTVLS